MEGKDRKVPLTFRWVPDEFLGDQLVRMVKGEGDGRTTPALVFCFNRDECWSVAEMLKGLDLLPPAPGPLNDEVDKLEWPQGVGPKLKQMLRRGVGVHHAGLLPKYRRVVEKLFQKQAAHRRRLHGDAGGGHQPAGPVGGADLAGQGAARQGEARGRQHRHQIFGRAGRPQFDDRGFVFALAHEDDVRILRWKEKYDHIPEDTRDPGLLKAKKALKKKKPTRRDNAVYWSESQYASCKPHRPASSTARGRCRGGCSRIC